MACAPMEKMILVATEHLCVVNQIHVPLRNGNTVY